jgi:regulator of sirC expression with transglutaminase-like and TPR domain
LTCFVCEETEGKIFYAARLEDVILQLCECCFREELYPEEMSPKDFVQVLQKNYQQTKHRIMNRGQLLRLLEVLAANREKEKEMWAAAQK